MSTRRSFSLATRLTLLLALAVLVVLGAAAKIVDWRADLAMQRRFDASLLARAQALASTFRFDGTQPMRAGGAVIGRFPANSSHARYALQCGDAVGVHTTPAPPPLVSGATPRFADVTMADGKAWRVVAFRVGDAAADGMVETSARGCALRFALERQPLQEILWRLDLILLVSLFGACALVVLLTPWLVRRGLRPLTALDAAMARIGPDAPGGRLPPVTTRELVPLVARFNRVLARMDAGLARERQFASGLAHELRTRLAELRALVDVETRYPSGGDPQAALAEAGAIGGELEATVTALLQLTRIQSGLEASATDRVPIRGLIDKAVARAERAAKARRLRIEISGRDDPALVTVVDPALCDIVLDNLVGNAVAYAPPGSVIRVRADRAGIQVANPAPELTPADLTHFGRRFWRKGERAGAHAGLGLALASAAAQALDMALTFVLDGTLLRATLVTRSASSAEGDPLREPRDRRGTGDAI